MIGDTSDTREIELVYALLESVWEEVGEASVLGLSPEEFLTPYYQHHVGGELAARFRFILREAGLLEGQDA